MKRAARWGRPFSSEKKALFSVDGKADAARNMGSWAKGEEIDAVTALGDNHEDQHQIHGREDQ